MFLRHLFERVSESTDLFEAHIVKINFHKIPSFVNKFLSCDEALRLATHDFQERFVLL